MPLRLPLKTTNPADPSCFVWKCRTTIHIYIYICMYSMNWFIIMCVCLKIGYPKIWWFIIIFQGHLGVYTPCSGTRAMKGAPATSVHRPLPSRPNNSPPPRHGKAQQGILGAAAEKFLDPMLNYGKFWWVVNPHQKNQSRWPQSAKG